MKERIPLLLLIRRIHLFLALFLMPWVLMYALSTLGMHHRVLFTGHEQRVHPGYEWISTEPYTRLFDVEEDRQVVAREILKDLDMAGAFSVRGDLGQGSLTIIRDHPMRSYQVTYEAGPATVQIERQKFGLNFFLEMLHRRRGFEQSFITNNLWAIVVDGVIVTILLWAVTGVWMWWSMVRTRKPGAWCLASGIALFLLFLINL